jgi:purine-nucleoside phosphorylase
LIIALLPALTIAATSTAASNDDLDSPHNVASVEKLAERLHSATRFPNPTIGIVAGPGLEALKGLFVGDTDTISFNSIAGVPKTNAESNGSGLTIGKLNTDGQPIAIMMSGHVQTHEGYSFWQSSLPIRVMQKLGVQLVVLTNIAGALNHSLHPSNIMVVKDHINWPAFAGGSPLYGLRDDSLGQRFLSLWNMYDSGYCKAALTSAAQLGMSDIVREGIMAVYPGPSFETVAEAKALLMLGGDVSSTVAQEAIVARHCGMKVLAFTVVTNYVPIDSDEKKADGPVIVQYRDMIKVAESTTPALSALIQHTLSSISPIEAGGRKRGF